MMKIKIQCPLLNRIILRDHKNDNTYRIITSAGGFSVMFKCMGQAISDFNGQLILLSVFQLSSVLRDVIMELNHFGSDQL